ncbi:acyl-CoA dehydrogenase family protein [Camelimonas lactis]|uniref:Acyl-[acyl-carrier-protein] dehydrogenase MbtN n=1 Tax=Camelimonas lactis TaxID=659006 RepID=A0A4R2GRL4_9HYPH|nr:acyl-CoA dehydrogenase family protein [Camelimonas lactis]TCO12712.1 acyl-CoA dehydrogenase [Camelimonas lactis]
MTDQSHLTAEHEALRQSVARFIAREIAPHYSQWERDGAMPRELWRKMGDAGFLGCCLPEAWGGSGAGIHHALVIIEEFARAFIALPGFYTHAEIIAPYIVHYGTEEQKQRWLPGCASGDVVLSIAMTEPGAGSDLKGTRTIARPDGDDFLISGQKTFITNGLHADLIIVLAGIEGDPPGKKTLFLVEADRTGFSRGRVLEKLGQKAQDTAELFFDNVRVPASNILGVRGEGLHYLMAQLGRERLMVGMTAVAGAEAAFRETLAYTNQRQAFGQSISQFQHLRFKLAEMKTEVTVARAFLEQCVSRFLDGALPPEHAAMCKYWLTDVEAKVLDQCVQMHGGYGFMREYPVARAYADSRGQRIYAGTNEVMKEIIARTL